MEKKIIVLYVHHGSVPGGAPKSLANMVYGIALDPDYSCTIGCIRPEMLSYFFSNNISVVIYPKTGLYSGRIFIGWSRGLGIRKLLVLLAEIIKAPYFIAAEVRFLKRFKADIVHLNSSILWMSGIAARICDIPVVWHIREASNDSRYNLIRIAYAWFIRKIAKKVVCIGPQEYTKIGGEKSAKVEMIYNSLSDSYFSAKDQDTSKVKQRLGLPQRSFLFLSLGGMSFRKGTYQFVDALNHLPDSFVAVLAGAKPELGIKRPSFIDRTFFRLEELLVSRGLKGCLSWKYSLRLAATLSQIAHHRLVMTGVLTDVQDLLTACDVLVFAGTTPHSARPVYEAWALKKPIIAFDNEVMRKDIDHGVDGLLIPGQDSRALAKAIEYIQEHPQQAKKMGQKGFLKAIDRFSMEKNNLRIANIYKEILSENRI